MKNPSYLSHNIYPLSDEWESPRVSSGFQHRNSMVTLGRSEQCVSKEIQQTQDRLGEPCDIALSNQRSAGHGFVTQLTNGCFAEEKLLTKHPTLHSNHTRWSLTANINSGLFIR